MDPHGEFFYGERYRVFLPRAQAYAAFLNRYLIIQLASKIDFYYSTGDNLPILVFLGRWRGAGIIFGALAGRRFTNHFLVQYRLVRPWLVDP